MKDFLINLLGADSIIESVEDLAPYRDDYSRQTRKILRWSHSRQRPSRCKQ